jgi:hypothetical protein
MQNTFNQVAGFTLLMVLLMFANRTKIGHNIIYYSLLLMIMTILLVEAPFYAAILGNLSFSGGTVTPGNGETSTGEVRPVG